MKFVDDDDDDDDNIVVADFVDFIYDLFKSTLTSLYRVYYGPLQACISLK